MEDADATDSPDGASTKGDTQPRTPARDLAPSDAELVKLSLDGDDAAFGQLVVRYEARIRRLAFSFVRDEGLAEDIAQDSFVQAMRRLRTLHDAESFRSWLFSISVNRARDEIRRRARFVALPDEETRPAGLSWAVRELPAARELRPYLAAAIAALPNRYRAPLLLKEIEGMTYAEVARTLGVPMGTAQIRIHRARLRLRERLRELGIEGTGP